MMMMMMMTMMVMHPIPQGGGAQAQPNLRVPIYLCVHPVAELLNLTW